MSCFEKGSLDEQATVDKMYSLFEPFGKYPVAKYFFVDFDLSYDSAENYRLGSVTVLRL